jgi:hypothetical protein
LEKVKGAKRATIIFDDDKDQVSREELGFGANPNKKEEVTYSKTVRTTNHVANQLNSLTKIGLGKTVSEVIQSLIDSKLDSLPDTTKRKYDMLLDIAEKQDFLTHK